MTKRLWNIYLSGEIHSNWREEIKQGAKNSALDIEFTSAITNHDDSDDCGVAILGAADNDFNKDQMGSKINAIRSRVLIEEADMAVIRFGDKYKQWNAAFDAGYCAAIGTPYITIHGDEINHPLKEIDGASQAVARNTDQVVKILKYIISGKLDR